jgi:hypothetical protein
MRDYFFFAADDTPIPVSQMADSDIADVLARGPELLCDATPVASIIERLRIEQTSRKLGL